LYFHLVNLNQKKQEVLTTHDLSIGYTHNGKGKTVQSALNLQLNAGKLVCLLGKNGCGKSTLLRTLAGLQEALAGTILIGNKELSTLSAQERAQLMALVLTEGADIENTTVRQLVAIGRQPHTSWWGTLHSTDEQKIDDALKMVHLQDLAHKNINEISDGERQRAMLARALVQDTPLILLDEPTAHLDLPNRVEMMLLLHRLAHQTGKAILLSTHELDIALQAADSIWLMSENQPLTSGVPEDLVLNGSFGRVFDNPHYFFNTANGNFSMNYSLSKAVSLSGDKTRSYWTLRALARNGYKVTNDAENTIEATENEWSMNGERYHSIEKLLEQLNKIG
jgi:iron complex transport system ATP-binding protein